MLKFETRAWSLLNIRASHWKSSGVPLAERFPYPGKLQAQCMLRTQVGLWQKLASVGHHKERLDIDKLECVSWNDKDDGEKSGRWDFVLFVQKYPINTTGLQGPLRHYPAVGLGIDMFYSENKRSHAGEAEKKRLSPVIGGLDHWLKSWCLCSFRDAPGEKRWEEGVFYIPGDS